MSDGTITIDEDELEQLIDERVEERINERQTEISRRRVLGAAAGAASVGAMGFAAGSASAADPPDANGTVYFDQIGDPDHPVSQLYTDQGNPNVSVHGASDHDDSVPVDGTNSGLEIQKEGTDGTGIINFNVVPDSGENQFGPQKAGYWRGDIEQLGSVDGFQDVGLADPANNTGYEDIFTEEFKTSDFPDFEGPGNNVWMRFQAKWSKIPIWGDRGTWVKKPSPDPNKYQTYVLLSDGQNSRGEYFRLFYFPAVDFTPPARIADPEVYLDD